MYCLIFSVLSFLSLFILPFILNNMYVDIMLSIRYIINNIIASDAMAFGDNKFTSFITAGCNTYIISDAKRPKGIIVSRQILPLMLNFLFE